jgi:hypothetical protein
LGHVAQHEAQNKMSLNNVAMIFAPNLFPPAWLSKTSSSDSEEHLAQQVRTHSSIKLTFLFIIYVIKHVINVKVEVAAESCRLVQLMVQAGPRLWSVPPGLVRQLRQQYEAERFQVAPHSLKENSKPVSYI